MKQQNRRKYRIYPLICVVLLSALLFPTGALADTITPKQISEELAPEACSNHPVTVSKDVVTASSLDVMLAIDITSSMEDVINQVRRSAAKISADTSASVADSRLGLAAIADHRIYSRSDPWILVQDFSSSPETLQQALNSISSNGDGGDPPEAYLYGLQQTTKLDWRSDARRVVLLFGDSWPHDPDPGDDGREGTADDISLDAVVQELNAANITVLAIFTDPDYQSFYETIAKQTGGEAFRIDQVERIPTVIKELIQNTIKRIGAITLQGEGPEGSWLSWTPPSHQNVPPREERTFDLTICVPADATPGRHSFAVKVLADGTPMGQIPIQIDVPARPAVVPVPPGDAASPTITPTITPTATLSPTLVLPVPVAVVTTQAFPWWLLLILLLLALGGGLWWYLRSRPTLTSSRPPTIRTAPGGRPPSTELPSNPTPEGEDILPERESRSSQQPPKAKTIAREGQRLPGAEGSNDNNAQTGR